jgi:hypothetical protein
MLVRMLRMRRDSIVATLVMAIALIALASATSAFAEPTGKFARFNHCPKSTEGVKLCLYSEVYAGKVTLDKQTVPINEEGKTPIILQGGIKRNPETEVETFVAASGAESLSKTGQNVPGGLLDLVNCTEIKAEGLLKFLGELARAACKAVFENHTTGIEAVTELAKPASEITINKRNLILEEGTALGLPVKVKLENTFLGSECYIGSSSNPLQLNMTTGATSPNPPNTSIHGEVGFINAEDEFEFIEIPKNILVNNEFSAPEASGCGGIFAVLIDPLIDSKIGLPSADGKNTAIQDANLYEATIKAVKESE